MHTSSQVEALNTRLDYVPPLNLNSQLICHSQSVTAFQSQLSFVTSMELTRLSNRALLSILSTPSYARTSPPQRVDFASPLPYLLLSACLGTWRTLRPWKASVYKHIPPNMMSTTSCFALPRSPKCRWTDFVVYISILKICPGHIAVFPSSHFNEYNWDRIRFRCLSAQGDKTW